LRAETELRRAARMAAAASMDEAVAKGDLHALKAIVAGKSREEAAALINSQGQQGKDSLLFKVSIL